jgi:hypothetical protein
MKRAAILFSAQIVITLVFAACIPEDEQPRQNRYGVAGDAYTAYDPNALTPSPTPSVDSTPVPEAVVAATPTPTPTPEQRLYGIPVPGKPGFIMSPHAPYQGQIDARGFPPGTDIKDPYSGKIIYVP